MYVTYISFGNNFSAKQTAWDILPITNYLWMFNRENNSLLITLTATNGIIDQLLMIIAGLNNGDRLN